MTPALPSLLLALLISLAALTPASAQGLPIPPALAARAAAGEAVDVIVGVAAAASLEGRLDARTRIAQRVAIARAVDDVRARAAAAGASVGDRFEGLPYFRATLTSAALAALVAVPGVSSVEAVVPYRAQLRQSATLVQAPPAWAAGATGAGWTIAVLDSGVQSSHPFFGGRVVSQACFSTLAGASSLCPGGAPSSTAFGSAEPCTGLGECDHGTHVAGIAAGAGGPGGLQGIAPGATVMAVQVFSRVDDDTACGGSNRAPCLLSSNADLLSGLAHVLSVAGAGNAARIAAVNISIGGGRYTSPGQCDAANPSLKTAIDHLRSLGIATAIAAGNQGYGDALSAPACISSAISVGATTDAAPLSVPGYSNDASFLTLLAPGSDISSSVPGSGYALKLGTSMAAPHVAGAWAVLKHAAPAASVDLVLGALTTTGTPVVDAATGRTHPFINIDEARRLLTGAGGSPRPGAPTGFDASVLGNTVTFSWTPPVVGAPATGYALLARTATGGPVTAAVPVGNVTSFTTTAADGVYVVAVVAVNAAGAGPESNALTLTLPGGLGRPDPPTNLQMTIAGSSATFRWSPPQAGGPVEQYVFIAGDVPGFWVPAVSIDLPPTQTTLTVPNIPPGTYYVRVYARNRFGPSAYSSNEVVVPIAGATPPSAPILAPPFVQGDAVRVSWLAGSGSAPTSYLLVAALTPGGPPAVSAAVAGATASFSGVRSGTYFLRVYGVNAAGAGPPSNEVQLMVQ